MLLPTTFNVIVYFYQILFNHFNLNYDQKVLHFIHTIGHNLICIFQQLLFTPFSFLFLAYLVTFVQVPEPALHLDLPREVFWLHKLPSAGSRTRKSDRPSTRTSSRSSRVDLSEERARTVRRRASGSKAAPLLRQTRKFGRIILQK
jgi:hypothetical protein